MKKAKTTKKKPANPNVVRFAIQNLGNCDWLNCDDAGDQGWEEEADNATLFHSLIDAMKIATLLEEGWMIRKVIFDQDQKRVYPREIVCTALNEPPKKEYPIHTTETFRSTSAEPNITSLPKKEYWWVITTTKKPVKFYNAEEGVWTDDVRKASLFPNRGGAIGTIADDKLEYCAAVLLLR